MSRKYSRLCVGRATFCFPVHSRTLGSNWKPKPTSRSIRRFSSSSIKTGHSKTDRSLSSFLNSRGSSFSFLEVLDVSNNQISGGIPELRQGSRLKVVNIGGNKIAGHIPNSVSNLIQLERFDISRNKITGTIPTSLGLLGKLQWLDLSINGLTGKIPTSLLGIQGLRHASFRANKFCGEIPQGRPFNIFPASAYVHNLCLCGKPLPPCRGKNQINKHSRKTPEIEKGQ